MFHTNIGAVQNVEFKMQNSKCKIQNSEFKISQLLTLHF